MDVAIGTTAETTQIQWHVTSTSLSTTQDAVQANQNTEGANTGPSIQEIAHTSCTAVKQVRTSSPVLQKYAHNSNTADK
jgi:hypothetical protein